MIKSGDTEFLISGMNFKVNFDKKSKNEIVYIGQVVESKMENGNWIEGRMLNGDETYHNELVRVFGREFDVDDNYKGQKTSLDVKEGEQFVYSPGSNQKISTPGIYKVTLYFRNDR